MSADRHPVEADTTDMMVGMEPITALSASIAVIGITGQLVAIRNPRAGWGISLAIQPLWYAFYIATGGYSLILLSTGYGAAAFLHLRKAVRARRRTATRTSRRAALRARTHRRRTQAQRRLTCVLTAQPC